MRLPRPFSEPGWVAGALALAALLAAPTSAQAIPLLGIGAGAAAFGDVLTGSQSGLGYTLEGNVELLGMEAHGTMLAGLGGGQTLTEVGMRREISFLPMLSLKPYLGYSLQNFFGSRGYDSGLEARLEAAFSPILSPIWFEGHMGATFPLGYQQLITSTLIGAYFSPLPLVSVGARWRTYHEPSGTGDFGAAELGLRVSI